MTQTANRYNLKGRSQHSEFCITHISDQRPEELNGKRYAVIVVNFNETALLLSATLPLASHHPTLCVLPFTLLRIGFK